MLGCLAYFVRGSCGRLNLILTLYNLLFLVHDGARPLSRNHHSTADFKIGIVVRNSELIALAVCSSDLFSSESVLLMIYCVLLLTIGSSWRGT